jgi:cytochrome c oxidase assembly protein subunit 15
VPPFALRLGRGTTGLVTVVLFTGAITTATGPHGGDDRAERLDFALVTVTRIHSVTVWVFLTSLLGLLVWLARWGAPARLLRVIHITLGLAVFQGVVGYLQYATELPAGLVELHLAGAVLVWCGTLFTHLELFEHPEVAAPETPSSPTDIRAAAPT